MRYDRLTHSRISGAAICRRMIYPSPDLYDDTPLTMNAIPSANADNLRN
jgi:hypothetical protein